MKQSRYSKYQNLNSCQTSIYSEMEHGKLKIDVMILKNAGDTEPIPTESVQVQAFNKSMESISLNPAPFGDHLIETHMRGTIAHCILFADHDIDELECVDVSFKGEQGRFFLDKIDQQKKGSK